MLINFKSASYRIISMDFGDYDFIKVKTSSSNNLLGSELIQEPIQTPNLTPNWSKSNKNWQKCYLVLTMLIISCMEQKSTNPIFSKRARSIFFSFSRAERWRSVVLADVRHEFGAFFIYYIGFPLTVSTLIPTQPIFRGGLEAKNRQYLFVQK